MSLNVLMKNFFLKIKKRPIFIPLNNETKSFIVKNNNEKARFSLQQTKLSVLK